MLKEYQRIFFCFFFSQCLFLKVNFKSNISKYKAKSPLSVSSYLVFVIENVSMVTIPFFVFWGIVRFNAAFRLKFAFYLWLLFYLNITL